MTFLQALKSGFFNYTEASGQVRPAPHSGGSICSCGAAWRALCLVLEARLGLLFFWYLSGTVIFSYLQDAATFSDLMYVPYLC